VLEIGSKFFSVFSKLGQVVSYVMLLFDFFLHSQFGVAVFAQGDAYFSGEHGPWFSEAKAPELL